MNLTLALETEMWKTLSTKKLSRSIDAGKIFGWTTYIQYEQINLDHNFRTYLEGTQVVRGSQSHAINFRGANKQ